MRGDTLLAARTKGTTLHIGEILLTALYFLVILGVMVVIHEFGHFAVAKLCGVRVEAFSIGMGKRLFGYVHNGTDYKVCMLPIGGYVKMTGETEMEMIQTSPTETDVVAPPSVFNADGTHARTHDSGNFNTKPRWQRMLVALAGPIANFLLAIFLFTVVAHFHHESIESLQDRSDIDYVVAGSQAAKAGIVPGDTIVRFDTINNPTWQDISVITGLKAGHDLAFSFTHNGQRVDTLLHASYTGAAEDFMPDDLGPTFGLVPSLQSTPIIVSKIPDATSPAAQSGLQPGDTILSMDGKPFHSALATGAYMADQGGRAVTLQTIHNGVPRSLTVQPRLMAGAKGKEAYLLGFQPVPPASTVSKLPLKQAVATGWHDFTKNSTMIFDILGGMVKRQVSVRNMAGPVGMAQQVGIARDMGTWAVFALAASISVNLGIFNLLPMPILDGGMILFLLIESLIRRDVNAQLKERIYQVAFVCIILFAAFIIFNDITKLSVFSRKG